MGSQRVDTTELLSLSTFLLGFSICSSVSRELVITLWSSFMLTALKFLSDNFNSWITSVLLSVGSLFSNKLWFSWSLVWPVIFACVLDIFNSMLGNSWPFKKLSSRQLPSLGLACGFCWLFRLSRHPHCGRPGPVLLITVRCGKSHFSYPLPQSSSRSVPHGFRAV